MQQPQRVLPADVFDALELSSIEWGGIGAGHFRRYLDAADTPTNYGDQFNTRPCCIHGHAQFLDGTVESHGFGKGPCSQALSLAGIQPYDNDAVYLWPEEVLSFAEWCERLNVVRGE